MGKRAHKRQKTEKSSVQAPQPLGSQGVNPSLLDDAGKDDEERRLESMLFGKAYVPAPLNENILLVSDDEEAEAEGGAEFQTMLDSELFFVDSTTEHQGADRPNVDFEMDVAEHADELGGNEEKESEGESEDEDEDENEDAEKGTSDEEEKIVEPVASSSKPAQERRAPAWLDPDDADLEVSLANNKRLRKMRDALAEDVVGGREYERRLRRQFERINPTPEWAKKARSKLHPSKKRRVTGSSDEEDEPMDGDEDLSDILASVGGIMGRRRRALQQGTLSIERLRDANISAPAEGAIKAVQFHPSTETPLLLTASEDRRLRFFNIDGHTNPHLQTVHIPSLPITTAMFHPVGSTVLLTGPRPFFYTYDLQTGAAIKSPRGLWGTTFSGANMQDGSMEICAFDPSGEVLAVAGRRGYVHLVDWRSGAGQVVGSVKMNSGVKSLWWTSGRDRGSELMSLGEDSEVYVWDVGERRCLSKWKDDGGYGSQIMGGDRAGQYLGIGSRHGIVNVYGSQAANAFTDGIPKPLKSIGNLTTSITSLRFNHDSQLMAIASNTKKDQLRVVHLPSLTVFSNWPTSGTPLGHVTSLDFSAQSEYIATGNSRGRVLLYHLRDFAQQ